MTYKIEEIQGIGPAFAQKLSAAGITTTSDMLALCCTETGREKVAEKTGLSRSQILKWTNMADLMRVSGIGPQYSELLEYVGVDTIKELRHRNGANLAAKMVEINEEKHLSGSAPSEKTVKSWIDSAKELDSLISY